MARAYVERAVTSGWTPWSTEGSVSYLRWSCGTTTFVIAVEVLPAESTHATPIVYTRPERSDPARAARRLTVRPLGVVQSGVPPIAGWLLVTLVISQLGERSATSVTLTLIAIGTSFPFGGHSDAGFAATLVIVGGVVSRTVTEKSDMPLHPFAVVAAAVKVDMPSAVGVPDTMPLAASSRRPAGSAPFVMLNVYGPLAPVALTWPA